MIKNPKKDEAVSPDWQRIKQFVGGATPQKKHPLQQEAERIGMRKPVHLDEGGDPAEEALRQSLGGFMPQANQAVLPSQPPPVIPPQSHVSAGQPLTPSAVAPAPPLTPDTNYDQQASKIMGGVTPEMIRNLAQKYAQPSPMNRVGMGIAGIGDAIQSVGGIKGENFKNAQDMFDKNRDFAMKAPGQISAVGKEQYGLSHELQTYDPNSPFSKVTQNANRQILKTMGASDEQISSMPAMAINDVVGHQVTLEDALARIKQEGTYQRGMLGIQQQGANTAEAAQKTRAQEVNKDITKEAASHWFLHPKNAYDASGKLSAPNQVQFEPDVLAYAQKHGIDPTQAATIKAKRTGM